MSTSPDESKEHKGSSPHSSDEESSTSSTSTASLIELSEAMSPLLVPIKDDEEEDEDVEELSAALSDAQQDEHTPVLRPSLTPRTNSSSSSSASSSPLISNTSVTPLLQKRGTISPSPSYSSSTVTTSQNNKSVPTSLAWKPTRSFSDTTASAYKSRPLTGKAEGVVAEASGLAPVSLLQVVRERDGTLTPTTEKKAWFHRFAETIKKEGSPLPRQDSFTGTIQGEEDPGEPLIELDESAPPPPPQPQQDEGDLTDSSSLSVSPSVKSLRSNLGPTVSQLRDDDASTSSSVRAPSMVTAAPSVREKIMEQHSPVPRTSNDRFHEMFPAIPTTDTLIEDYSCALQRSILVQGFLYLSEGHFAFRPNIFGATLVVPWAEVTAVDKRMTALVIPNAIEISTAHSKHLFAFFLNRDASFDIISSIWRHWAVESSLHHDSSSSSPAPSPVPPDAASTTSRNELDRDKKFKFADLFTAFKPVPSPLSAAAAASEPTEAEKFKQETIRSRSGSSAVPGTNEGPRHPPTKYDGEEYKNLAIELVLPTSTDLTWELLYEDKEFMRKFLEEDQKVKELKLNDWEEGEPKRRKWSYIRPLHASVGPKETLCLLEDVIEKADPDNYYTAISTTRTPDVPAGDGFSVKTRLVVTWDESGGARVRVTTEVEWTKVNRILKGIIERSCLNGQKEYHVALEKALRSHIADDGAKYKIVGAVPAPIEATSFEAPSESFRLSAYLPSPLVVFTLLTFLLLLVTNFFTLIALRHQARAAHEARHGILPTSPSLPKLSHYLTKLARTGARERVADPMKELDTIKSIANALEAQARDLHQRVGELQFVDQ